MVQHRPVPAAHRLLSLDIVLALLALAGGLRVLYLAAPEPALPTEAATVAHAYALGTLTSFADAGGAGASPFGWLQLAAATMVSDAFGRSATALAAVRETVLAAALVGAVLTWVLARRLGLTRWASAAAVLLLAASPLALGVQRLVVVEHLAVAWALGALVLITRPGARIRHDTAAAGCLLAAVLTSPLALFFLPAAGWLLARRAPVRAAWVAVLLNLGLGIAFGPAAAVLRPHLAAATRPSVADWAALDPAWVALSAAALLAGLAVKKVRPLAATGVLLAATLLVPSVPSTAVLALLLPVTPLLLAAIAQAATRRRSEPRHASTHGSTSGRPRPEPAGATRTAIPWPFPAHHGRRLRRRTEAAARMHASHRSSTETAPADPHPTCQHRGNTDHGWTETPPGDPTPNPNPHPTRNTGRRRTEAVDPVSPHPTRTHRRDTDHHRTEAERTEPTHTADPHPTRTHRRDTGRRRTEAERTEPVDPVSPHPGRIGHRRTETAPTEPATLHPAASHPGRTARRRVVAGVAGGVLAAALAVSWGGGYPALRATVDRGGPLASARDWLRGNASGSRLLVDDAAWAELANAGWPTGLLAPPAACSVTCPPAEWGVFGRDETTLRTHYPALDGAFAGAGATAVFGSGNTRVTVWRLGLPPADPAAPPEAPVRAHAGEALTASARIALSSEAAAVLREGCADPRLIATIAALAAIQPVGVAAFPEVPGEDAAGQPRRRVLLTGREDGTTAFYTGQRDLFRPASVVRTAGGVLVTYPLFAPPGLLPLTR
ncbi:glycosyl transferase [Amycolatopsis sp. DG1A-15b]|uniref:glycosyl transferase n=1 Tax=Amycolatopsis sp. DG1A-15b TaxID=3052846 RepID=UPI00255C1592|nr:glycosyl transferase [Amycolatopsis sp. DG1A-15b]WIX91706.1 glycosyl transferase [Amycolatopsis sp. DG1A-15b]